ATAAVVIVAGAGFLLANGQLQQHRSPSSNGARATASPRPLFPSAKGAATRALGNRVSVHYQLNGKSATTTAYVSRANFLRHTLGGRVRKDVSQSVGIGPSYSQGPPRPSGSVPARNLRFSIPRLADCLSRINSGRTVLLVAVAHFLGRPARIIVLRPP